MVIHTFRRFVCALALFAIAHTALSQATVEEAMDGILTRFYANMSLDELYALDAVKVKSLLTPEELAVLATKHWYFDVDVPVVVSVLRNVDQQVAPYWLEEGGFAKTDMTVTNEEDWKYEVWQKEFPAGRVELGINGFDNFRPHYLVCVAAKDPAAKATISGLHPDRFSIEEMKEGAKCYHDWTELTIKTLPDALRGQQLLTTIRGRGREACLVGAFRKTAYPSAERPQPVFLTWSEDPKTTQNVQWRTSTAVNDGGIRYRVKGSGAAFATAPATIKKMQDRMLANDRYCHWYTAVLRELAPGTTYEYQAGSPMMDLWSEPLEFTTAPAAPEPFSFFFLTDVHNRPEYGELLKKTFAAHPEAAFSVISGDLVGTGLERDNWDAMLSLGEPMFKLRPVMPSIGNHDAQYGLGPGMYLDIFGLPENGPPNPELERAYSFVYGDVEFFVLDVMSDSAPQGEWLRGALAKSTAKWKVAMFHFPFYTRRTDEYAELQKDWGTLFDEFHVDLVLQGHTHIYIRTKPMKAAKVVQSTAEGTVYLQSISIPADHSERLRQMPDFVDKYLPKGSLCCLFRAEGNTLSYKAINLDGEVMDEYSISK